MIWTKDNLKPYGTFVQGDIPDILPPWQSRRQWMVDKQCEYITRLGVVVKLDRGFKTDLASIPRFLRSFFGANMRETVAAIIHDNLYRDQGERLNVLSGKREVLTRKQCDKILYDVMKLAQTGRVRAWFIYRGVRLGGWVAWMKNRKAR